jgi:hypothetical protein
MDNEKELDLNQIFNEVIKLHKVEPNCYPLQFDLDNIRELYEFLLEFTTLLFKYFYGDENEKVNLSILSQQDFDKINKYINAIGFTGTFQILPANAHYLNYANDYRYDRINITLDTKLENLFLGLKCEQLLYIISFRKL